jgi:methionyl-tRNA formyltransferase
VKIGVIGNGKMAVECMKEMLSHENVKIVFGICQPEKDPQDAVNYFCREKNIDVQTFRRINSPEALEFIKSKEPDYIFSINNFRLLSENLIKIPAKGIINFHNGPLPRYGGVNIPSWVIINGEKEHGVTWHFVDSGIDTGDIIAQEMFPLDDDITASRLMTMSIIAGLKLFKVFFPQLLKEQINRIPQTGESLYYSLKDLPENNGIIDFSWTYDKISRLVRGLNFFPFNNDFVSAKIFYSGKTLIVNDVSKSSDNANYRDGEIVKTGEEELLIACHDAVISLDSITDEETNELTPEEVLTFLGVKQGDIIENIPVN